MNKTEICPWCSTETKIIWVHGHGQCLNCGINIDECSRGEQCSENNSPAENTDEE
ncbi:MAG: hypothetical protein IPM56_15590 [Ignavibacteriales bacterium]|nr:MAG: hypothetical protein IPM56_15590 [Ignavibacteriales bacterium]